MKNILKYIKEILRYFPMITVVVMIVSALYVTAFYGVDANVGIVLIWQVLFVSFLCSFSPLFYLGCERNSGGKNHFWLRALLDYIYVNAVVLGWGIAFDWFEPSQLPMVIGMLLAVVLAFVLNMVLAFLLDLKTTNAINKKLRERNGER